MKKMMMQILLLLILQVQAYECLAQVKGTVNIDTQALSSDDIDAIMKKGKDLFNNARYEEALREFLIITQSSEAPQEDRIKAHYFSMRIYRAYGEDEKVKQEIKEILKLNPGYTPSSRESASIKKFFRDIKEELLREQKAGEKIVRSPVLKEDMAIFEHSLNKISSSQESFSLKVTDIEKELKKLRLSFYITSLTLFLLLAVGVGFK